jgi:DNA repair protein RadA/Sms
VAQTAARLKEAAKLGFARAFVPDTVRSEAGDAGTVLRAVGPLVDLVAEIAPKGGERKAAEPARK